MAWPIRLALALMLVAAPAPASPAVPYSAWESAQHALPPGSVPERAPAPSPEEPELSRRLFEFTPDVGVALPSCSGRGATCGDLAPGAEMGLTALYRPLPHFGFGMTARLDALSLGRGAADAPSAQMTFFGVVGRLYAFEAGILEPYLELALGGGSLESTSRAAESELRTRAEFTPAARVSAGVDFALNPWLRLGPALALSEYVPSSVSRCSGRRCSRLDLADAPIPRGVTSFALRLTFTTGERL